MTTENVSIPDHARELRLTYIGAVPHTLFTSLVWLASGLWGQFVSSSQAIAMFIIGGTFIFVGGEGIRKLMKAPDQMSKDNKLSQLFMLLAFTIPMSYPLIYLACRNNAELFFPAFMILVGAHYLPFIYGYRMPTFGALAIILVALGTFFGVFYRAGFSIPAYVTSAVLAVFAILHYSIIKKQSL